MNTEVDTYFQDARSWSDDIFTGLKASNNRYKIITVALSVLIIVLTVCVATLIPLQHIEPLLINHYVDGSISVARPGKQYKPLDQSEVESDIVRYILNREAYDYVSFDRQYHLVNLLSSPMVAKQYRLQQHSSNAKAPVNLLSDKKYRTVHVDDVVFIDNASLNNKSKTKQQTHRNLAQVDYNVVEHDIATDHTVTLPYRAIVSWQYSGMPSDPASRWQNWSGFTVNYYQKSQRHIGG